MTAMADGTRRGPGGVLRCARCGLWLMLSLPVAAVLLLTLQLVRVSAHSAGLSSGNRLEQMVEVVAMLTLVASFFGGGAMWGRTLAHDFGFAQRQALLVGGVVYGAAALTLAAIEAELMQFIWDGWKMHILYGLLFTPTAFLVAGLAGGALTLVSPQRRRAGWVALGSGGAAALAYLLVVVVMDAAGMRVGGPRAAERFTMLVVTFVSMTAAAVVGSGVWGWLMARRRGRS